jgi:hypothetical protein
VLELQDKEWMVVLMVLEQLLLEVEVLVKLVQVLLTMAVEMVYLLQ